MPTAVGIGDRRAHHLHFLAFREDDPLRLAANALDDALQRRGDRVAPRRKLLPIGLEVLDRLAGDAGLHSCLCDGHRDRRDEARIEGDGNDILRPEARPVALIGSGDVVRNVFLGEIGERFRRGDLHRVVDGRGAHVERAAEDIGKAENVVDLVRIVRAAGRDDRVVADQGHFFGRDFRIGIGHGEDDRPCAHGADHVRGKRALGRKAEEHVGAVKSLGERPAVGLDRMRRLPLVHAVGTALVDDPLGIAEDDVFRVEAHRLDELDAGDRRRARAVADELGRLEVAAGQGQRVDEACRGDDRGAVLVVMEDGNVHDFAQPLLDDEAVRGLDVLEIDSAEGRAEKADAVDEFVDVFGIHLEVDRIDVGEALEEDGLALHDGLRGECA